MRQARKRISPTARPSEAVAAFLTALERTRKIESELWESHKVAGEKFDQLRTTLPGEKLRELQVQLGIELEPEAPPRAAARAPQAAGFDLIGETANARLDEAVRVHNPLAVATTIHMNAEEARRLAQEHPLIRARSAFDRFVEKTAAALLADKDLHAFVPGPTGRKLEPMRQETAEELVRLFHAPSTFRLPLPVTVSRERGGEMEFVPPYSAGAPSKIRRRLLEVAFGEAGPFVATVDSVAGAEVWNIACGARIIVQNLRTLRPGKSKPLEKPLCRALRKLFEDLVPDADERTKALKSALTDEALELMRRMEARWPDEHRLRVVAKVAERFGVERPPMKGKRSFEKEEEADEARVQRLRKRLGRTKRGPRQ